MQIAGAPLPVVRKLTDRQTVFASATVPQHNHFIKQCVQVRDSSYDTGVTFGAYRLQKWTELRLRATVQLSRPISTLVFFIVVCFWF